MSRPDEGMIHAWLDGELDAGEAARIEALVRDDPEWAAAAVEARGFIAASARIVGALDHVPANVIPKATAVDPKVAAIQSARSAPRGATRSAPWWAMRVAALLVIVVGTAVVVRRAPDGTATIALDQTTAKVDTAAAPPVAESTFATNQPAPKTANESAPPRIPMAAPAVAGVSAPQRIPRAAAATAGVLARPDVKDERRLGVVDSLGALGKVTAADKSSDVKKETLKAGAELSTVTTTSVGADRQSAPRAGAPVSALSSSGPPAGAANSQLTFNRPGNAPVAEECYRERTTIATTPQPLLRVGRLNDSTAIAGAIAGLRPEAGAGGAAARSLTVPEANALARSAVRMQVHGDTLLLSPAGTPVRIALKVPCSP